MSGNRFNFVEGFKSIMIRKRDVSDKFAMKGMFPKVEHWRNGILIATYSFPNAITKVGKDYLFNAGFNSGTVIAQSSWCMGLIDNAGFSALVDTDTMASHGWTEFTGYSQANRVAWGQATSTAQLVTNGTPCTFDITSAGNLYGIFIASNNTKGGTSGTLWTEGGFPAVVPIAIGDQIKNTYALSA